MIMQGVDFRDLQVDWWTPARSRDLRPGRGGARAWWSEVKCDSHTGGSEEVPASARCGHECSRSCGARADSLTGLTAEPWWRTATAHQALRRAPRV